MIGSLNLSQQLFLFIHLIICQSASQKQDLDQSENIRLPRNKHRLAAGLALLLLAVQGFQSVFTQNTENNNRRS